MCGVQPEAQAAIRMLWMSGAGRRWEKIMSSVFLSYSRDDLSVIERLGAQLKAIRGISIWRDQESLRGGE